MSMDLRHLRTQFNLYGIDRRQAACALYLSYSTLNRKLRGELPFTPWEYQQALSLIADKQSKKGEALPQSAQPPAAPGHQPA